MSDLQAMLVEQIDAQISEHFRHFRAELQADFDKAVKDAANPPAYLSRKQVADLLNISFPTLHQWMNNGELPYVKIGRATKFSRNDIEKFIKSRKARRV